MKIPAFGESQCFETKTNNRARAFVIPSADADLFSSYCRLLEKEDFEQKEARTNGGQFYAAYSRDNIGFFLNYYEGTRELYMVEETDCLYFSFCDKARGQSVAPQITQVELEDFGMCYAIRLSDGRFVVMDGGRPFEPDADRLFKCLKEGSPYETPVIACWIMTHPHSDHFEGYLAFMAKYADEVEIESYLLNFPEHDDFEHYAKLAQSDNRFETDSSSYANIPPMYEYMKKSGGIIYMGHTGQIYRFTDAVIEILACMDDTIHATDSINSSSLVMRMELGGQVILFMTDASFSAAKLNDKYGSYLKADILQVPHHGFSNGTTEESIRGYDLISPKVCMMPVSDFNAYYVFCAYQACTRHLMINVGIEEMITGTPQRTITLPYTAPAYAKRELAEKYLHGHRSAGANAWIFTELSTAEPDDFVFTILNTTHKISDVWIELFFEDRERNIRYIKTQIRGLFTKRINIVGDDVDGDALYFNWMSLKEKGIPENAYFSVRFLCETPIVVSHKNHKATYFA